MNSKQQTPRKMISTARTLGELRRRIDDWIFIMGTDACVGVQCGDYLNCVAMELVGINSQTRRIIGQEAIVLKRRPKRGDGNALKMF